MVVNPKAVAAREPGLLLASPPQGHDAARWSVNYSAHTARSRIYGSQEPGKLLTGHLIAFASGEF